MPSPFPGMDPFVEAQRWEGFHHRFINQLADMLVSQVRPRYEVEPEERIYVETAPGDLRAYIADVAVSQPAERDGGAPASAVAEIEPRSYTLPMPMEMREPSLVIRKTGEQSIVTVIELLSPTNKRPGSDGRREYLDKCRQPLSSSAHLVEIDLLLAGERMPTVPDLQPGTAYCCIVSRRELRPRADVFEWMLNSRLPKVPVPLAAGDADVVLDLQAAFAAVYDRSGYDYSLRYGESLPMTLPAEDEAWVRQRLGHRLGSR